MLKQTLVVSIVEVDLEREKMTSSMREFGTERITNVRRLEKNECDKHRSGNSNCIVLLVDKFAVHYGVLFEATNL